jgi:hypothetical protein
MRFSTRCSLRKYQRFDPVICAHAQDNKASKYSRTALDFRLALCAIAATDLQTAIGKQRQCDDVPTTQHPRQRVLPIDQYAEGQVHCPDATPA